MCRSRRFGKYDDRKCCDECRSNEKSHVIIYEDIYKEIDFLCKVCVKSYCYRKCREMLGIRRIVSIKKYKFIDKVFCDKCELNEWKYIVTP